MGAYPGSDLLAQHHAANVAVLIQVKDDDRQVIVFAQADGGGVHHLQSQSQNVHIRDLIEFLGTVDFQRIGVVNAIHARRLEDGFSLDLHGAQRSRRIGREIGIASAAGKDHDAALLQVTDCPAADERLSHLVHLDRRLHAGVYALLLERILQRERIDDRGQHPHVIGGHAVHVLGLLSHTTEKVSPAHHDR